MRVFGTFSFYAASSETTTKTKPMNFYTKNTLIAFENEVAELFNSAKIRSPVHLYSGNEDVMLDLFRPIKKEDWVFCSWRSHYQCLLKGVPKQLVSDRIIEGKSISLCFPEYRIYSSAIVGGIVPVAVGAAMALKRSGENATVYCFIGDMTSETGIVHESIKFSKNHDLPIRFIVEDNGKSVCTDTRQVWAQEKLSYEDSEDEFVTYYRYETKYPHAGAGVRVQF